MTEVDDHKEYKHYADIDNINVDIVDLTKPIQIECPKCTKVWPRIPLSVNFNCSKCREYIKRKKVREQTRERIQAIIRGDEIQYIKTAKNLKPKIEEEKVKQKIKEIPGEDEEISDRLIEVINKEEITLDDLEELSYDDQEQLEELLDGVGGGNMSEEEEVTDEEIEETIDEIQARYYPDQVEDGFIKPPKEETKSKSKDMVQVGSKQIERSKLKRLKKTLETTASMKTYITDIKEIASELGLSSIITSIADILNEHKEKKELEKLLLLLELEGRDLSDFEDGGSTATSSRKSGPPPAWP